MICNTNKITGFFIMRVSTEICFQIDFQLRRIQSIAYKKIDELYIHRVTTSDKE